MKVLLRSLTVFFFLLSFHMPAKASVLVVGVSVGYPPYYFEKNGVLTGFCIDLVAAIAEEMDMEVRYKEYPWNRLLISAEKGHVDAVMPLFRTKEREVYLYFDGLGLADETNHLFTLKDATISYMGSLDNIAAFRVGVVSGYSYGRDFDSFVFPRKIITKNDKHLVEMLMYDRFDVGVGNRYVVSYYAHQQGLRDSLKFLDPPITKETLYIGFTRKRNQTALAEEFAQALQAYKATAEYQKLMEKYKMGGQN